MLCTKYELRKCTREYSLAYIHDIPHSRDLKKTTWVKRALRIMDTIYSRAGFKRYLRLFILKCPKQETGSGYVELTTVVGTKKFMANEQPKV
jgi:hypothetical protein